MIKRSIITSLIFLCFGIGLARAVTPAQLAKAIRDYAVEKNPGWQKLEIRVTFKPDDKVVEQIKQLTDKATVIIADGYGTARAAGETLLPVTIKDQAAVHKFFVRAKVEALRPIVVAARLVNRGGLIGAADLTLEARDVALLPATYYTQLGMLVNSEAKIKILRNSAIFEWMVKTVPVVRGGGEVTIIVRSAGLQIKAKGRALEDGYVGQTVKVQRQGNKAILNGKVNAQGQVEVELK